jgi:hypothetical protein
LALQARGSQGRRFEVVGDGEAIPGELDDTVEAEEAEVVVVAAGTVV